VDLAIYTDLVTLILEILNCALSPACLRFNPNLISSLICRPALLDPLIGVSAFQDLIGDVDAVSSILWIQRTFALMERIPCCRP
jgi:hypothetical protein